MTRSYGLSGGLTLVAMVYAQTVCALTVVYVTTNGTGDGSNWVNATNSIQGAIDVIEDTNPTNTVAVSNGVYDVGAVAGFPTAVEAISNRVVIYKAITVRAASGDPADTLIVGAPAIAGDPEFPNGTGAVRCVYMTNGASLHGFTLTNGHTVAVHGLGWGNPSVRGGGVFTGTGAFTDESVISNCLIIGNAAWYSGGGTVGGTLYDCMVRNNSTLGPTASGGGGGGVFHSSMYRCQVISNETSVANGAGVAGSAAFSLFSCLIAHNTSGASLVLTNASQGGGVSGAINVYSCTISVNRARDIVAQSRGGGASGANLYDCVVLNNTADNGSGLDGGFASNTFFSGNTGRDGTVSTGSSLVDCTITGGTHLRSAAFSYSGYALRCTITNNVVGGFPGTGGGAEVATLTNCLIAYNSCADNAGGARAATLVNCTIVANTGDANAGGIFGGTVINCISRDNVGADDNGFTPSHSAGVGAAYGGGVGNITDDPLFVDVAAGNYRLTKGSPCRNAGTNQNWMTNAVDLDGFPRITAGTVDMGAYEEHMKPPPLTLIEVR